VQSKINSLLELCNRERLLYWLKKHVSGQFGSSVRANPSLHPIYYASLLGLKSSVMHFWKDYHSKFNQSLDFYENALDAAVGMGHAEVVVWLIDHIENPSRCYDFSRIVLHLRMNLPQTLRALLQAGPKPSISTEVLYALTVNPVGEEILEILVKENLASIHITEEMICAAAYNKWNRKIVEFLVKNFTREFPVSFRALLTVAGTSHSALQLLVNSRRGDIWLKEQDHLELAKEKSAYTIQKLVSLSMAIPITRSLIRTLTGSPSGSQILKLLLDTQTIENPLASLDVITVVKGFNRDTFDSLLRHRWEDNTLTEALIFAFAINCYFDPPGRGTVPGRDIRADGLIHRDYRPTLKHSTMRSSSEALMSLIDRKELVIDLNKDIIALITEQFEKDVILHLVNRVAGFRIFAGDVAHDRFSSLLGKHRSDLGLSQRILQVLDDSYKAIAIYPPTMYERSLQLKARLNRTKTENTTPMEGCNSAVLLGSLPEALPGLKYSTSEYADRFTIDVRPGWRVRGDAERGNDRVISQKSAYGRSKWTWGYFRVVQSGNEPEEPSHLDISRDKRFVGQGDFGSASDPVNLWSIV
jgi:hypothetical protein